LFFPFLLPGQEIPEIQKVLRLLAEKGRARVTEWAEAEKKEARPISTLPLSEVGMDLFFPEAPTGRSSLSFSLFFQATIEWATSHFLKKIYPNNFTFQLRFFQAIYYLFSDSNRPRIQATKVSISSVSSLRRNLKSASDFRIRWASWINSSFSILELSRVPGPAKIFSIALCLPCTEYLC
jgi:hypothetical protein